MDVELLWAVIAALAIGAVGALLVARLLAHRRTEDLPAVEARLQAAVAQLTQTALRDNADVFLRLARETLGREQSEAAGALREREQAISTLLEPIRSALARSEAQVQALERDRHEAFASLRTQIESIVQGQVSLSRETRNLVTALRRPEVRGRWGELTLRRVVELAGLSEHCDFSEQLALAGPAGALRPDLVVHLAGGRTLVVDAKTPLDAYLEAIEASTDEARAQALVRHGQQVEERIRELSAKSYWSQLPQSPEFAVLFLPGDQFLSAALGERPALLDNALRSNVILVTPSSLIALLKAVAHGWRQQAVAENAALIRDLGQDLHRRLATFGAHLGKTGRALASAVEAYNAAVGSYERQVIPGGRKFTELGAATGEPLAVPDAIEQQLRRLSGSDGP